VGARLGHERGGCSSRGGGAVSARWSSVTLPKDKARVTVVWRSNTSHERAFVTGNGRSYRARSLMTLVPIRRDNYGSEWCHGWTGREVDALTVAAAL
jgi:hypothetical protein